MTRYQTKKAKGECAWCLNRVDPHGAGESALCEEHKEKNRKHARAYSYLKNHHALREGQSQEERLELYEQLFTLNMKKRTMAYKQR